MFTALTLPAYIFVKVIGELLMKVSILPIPTTFDVLSNDPIMQNVNTALGSFVLMFYLCVILLFVAIVLLISASQLIMRKLKYTSILLVNSIFYTILFILSFLFLKFLNPLGFILLTFLILNAIITLIQIIFFYAEQRFKIGKAIKMGLLLFGRSVPTIFLSKIIVIAIFVLASFLFATVLSVLKSRIIITILFLIFILIFISVVRIYTTCLIKRLASRVDKEHKTFI